MAYLKGFGLENFRVFKDYTWFDFAPITLFVGPNNSGKSSVIKALLLLKDNINKGNLPTSFSLVSRSEMKEIFYEDFEPNNSKLYKNFEPSKLEFNDLVHGLNNLSAVVTKLSEKQKVVFDIPFQVITQYKNKMTGEDFFGESAIVRSDYLLSQSIFLADDISTNRFERMVKKIGEKKWKTLNGFPLVKYPKYRLTFDILTNNLFAKYKVEILTEDGNLLLQIAPCSIYFDINLYESFFNEDFTLSHNAKSFQVNVSENYEISLKDWFLKNYFTEENSELFSKKVLHSFFPYAKEYAKETSSSLLKSIKDIDYFSTIWNQQKRVYTEDDGLRTTQQLKKLVSQMHKGFNFDSFFGKYAQYFGVKGLPGVEYDENRGTLFPNIGGESFLSFGYGHSQIASLLFKIVIHATEKLVLIPVDTVLPNDDPNILILEEPETNLHPKLQSQLANLFADVRSKFNTQFLIETHSEYMVRKFQYLVAKGEMKPEDIVIHYFHDPNNIPAGEPQVKKITILEDGSLSDDFGAGFYDEAANLELELLRLKRNKSRQN